MPIQPFSMQTQPDFHTLVEIAEILVKMDPESIVSVNDPVLLKNFQRAIHFSRIALGLRNPGINKDVTSWVSGPADDMIRQGPCTNLPELGHVPQGHVVIGLTDSGNEVVRGLVQEDQKVKWFWKIDEQRLAIADRILKGNEVNRIFRDRDYTMNSVDKWEGNWHSDGDEWTYEINVLDTDGDKEVVEMYVRFEPENNKVAEVIFAGIEFCLEEMEDNSPQS